MPMCDCGCGEPTIKASSRFRRGHQIHSYPIVVPQPLSERFEAQVDRTAGHGPNGDCHVWTGSLVGRYGRIRLGGRRPYRLAHRVAWFLETGQWPTSQVHHTCDTPACVRFEHLWLGTQQDNLADMRAKGRDRWSKETAT